MTIIIVRTLETMPKKVKVPQTRQPIKYESPGLESGYLLVLAIKMSPGIVIETRVAKKPPKKLMIISMLERVVENVTTTVT